MWTQWAVSMHGVLDWRLSLCMTIITDLYAKNVFHCILDTRDNKKNHWKNQITGMGWGRVKTEEESWSQESAPSSGLLTFSFVFLLTATAQHSIQYIVLLHCELNWKVICSGSSSSQWFQIPTLSMKPAIKSLTSPVANAWSIKAICLIRKHLV